MKKHEKLNKIKMWLKRKFTTELAVLDSNGNDTGERELKVNWKGKLAIAGILTALTIGGILLIRAKQQAEEAGDEMTLECINTCEAFLNGEIENLPEESEEAAVIKY